MADEEDYSALPLEQRLVHKIWKVRAGAYGDLAAEVKRLDPDTQAGAFAGYEGFLGKMVTDTNMAAQEAGVAAATAFVQYAPSPTRRREELVAGVVAKGLSASKAGTRAGSVELLLMLSEVDTPAPVVAGVIEGFDAKQPKAVAAAVAAVREIVRAFGAKSAGLKPLLKALGTPFGHRDNAVRAEAQLLAVELYRWVGPAILPSLQDLPPVLLKELEAQFAAVAGDPPPQQARLLRSQQDQPEPEPAQAQRQQSRRAGNDDDDGADAGGGGGGEIDPWDLADPVDIVGRLPDGFHALMGSAKWKERKEAAEQLHETLRKTVRLQMSGGTGDVIQELGKKIGDTNINVATLAIQCLGRFAAGLRQAFAPYVQSTLPALVEKSKERKQSVVDAIRATADEYFAAATGGDLAAISDHYAAGTAHKNPQVRAEAHHFLRRCLAAVATRPARAALQRYADQLKAGLDDGDSGVRDAAAECLGTLSKLAPERDVAVLLDGIDKIKMGKISEHAERATVRARAAKPAAAAAAAPARTAPARPRPAPAAAKPSGAEGSGGGGGGGGLGAGMPPHLRRKLEASAQAAALKKAQREGRAEPAGAPAEPRAAPAEPRAPAPAPAPAPRPRPAAAPKRPATATSTSSAAPPKRSAGSAGADETVRMRFSPDDADAAIGEALPAAVLEGVGSAAWKERVAAVEQLHAFLRDEAARGAGVHPELVVRQLARRPGWRESNFQVTARAFQTITWMAGEAALDFTAGAAALCVPALVDRLGDVKLRAPAGEALVAIAERWSLRLVVGLALEPIAAQKSPKVVADCLAWLDAQLVDFGAAALPLRALVATVRSAGLQSSNAQTRARAVALMGTLRRAVGPTVMDLLADLNAQLVQLLEAEFERVAGDPLPPPTRTQGSLGSGAGSGSGSGSGSAPGAGAGSGPGDAMDDLFPRQDLHARVGPAVYRKLDDGNWKERKAALDAIQAALDAAHHRIQPAVSGDLYTALQRRLQDPNKNLVAMALGLLAALSIDSGAALPANIRIVAAATMRCLADKKPQLRAAALGALVAWAGASAAAVDQAVLPAMPAALADTSPELRAALLGWAADTLEPRAPARLPDLAPLVTPLFACLQDRNADVRRQATRVLALAVASCGFEAVHDACEHQLRGAARASVAPVIEELRAGLGAAAGAAADAPLRRAAGAPPPTLRGRPGPGSAAAAAAAADRAPSPAAEPAVMTASELLGRGAGPAAARAAPGVLRRPMAVRRPAGGDSAERLGAARPGSARPGSARPESAAVLSAAAQLARMTAEELEQLPPVLDRDARAKDARARRDMAAAAGAAAGAAASRWALLGDAAVRADLEQQLRDQAAAHLNPLLMRQLFAAGHHRDRECLAGLTALEEVLSIPSLAQQRFGLPLVADGAGDDSLAARLAAHLDLLLKFISIRMYDGSTHTLLKSLDLLERLVALVRAPWADYDAQAVVPALIARLGDAKEAVRARARRLLTQLVAQLYPPTRLFAMLLDLGVANRANARVRQEALDCIGFLVREHSAAGLAAVCPQPARAVPLIAQGVADRDSNVRSAALAVLVAVGEQLPGGAADLWRLCGRMPERERTMLEERLKRSSLAAGGPAASADRPASRASTGLPAIRARLAPAAAPPAAGLRAPSSSSGLGRAAPPGANTTATTNASAASRLARPQPASTVAQQQQPPPPRLSSQPSNGARPMFSLDFDNLSLPSYSSATAEQLDRPRGLGVMGGASPLPSAVAPPPPESRVPDRVESYAIGYGAGRSGRIQSALIGAGSDAAEFGLSGDSDRSVVAAAVADLRSDDPSAAEAALEQLQHQLDAGGAALAAVRRSAGDICTAVTGQLHWAYSTTDSSALEHARARMRKATVGLLINVFGDARLAAWVPQPAVQVLLDELMQRLADPALSASQRPEDEMTMQQQQHYHDYNVIPGGDQLVKAINSLVLKILDRADRTAVFVSLIRILDAAIRDPVPIPPQTDDQIARGAMADVIMKCLWRISKDLAQEIEAQFGPYLGSSVPVPEYVARPAAGDGGPSGHAIHVDAVLRVSEQFFVHIPGAEWRRREDRSRWMFGDLPKRTVKTISHSLAVKLRGHVWQFAGPLVAEAMREHPGVLVAPTSAQLQQPGQLAMWADDAHAQLSRVSETWEYLSRALQSAGDPHDRPAPQQMLELFRATSDTAGPPSSSSLADHGSPLLIASSPHMSFLQASSPLLGDRARSPVAATAASLADTATATTTTPGRPASYMSAAPPSAARGAPSTTASHAERLRALRERIGQQHQHQSQDQQPPPPASVRRSLAVPSDLAPNTHHHRVPPPSAPTVPTGQPSNMDDIRQRIAMMRSSLRSQK
ncbi:hypothetical protein H4R18_001043 [Coemansia javaensis]|uniref:TOG domain-containing protein n=1 Tax=Coemansia javaensis TaxID=2761396 RepID=A0A9W8HG96_9FUNG|nr:hypothetical protein H4R18_001043 [Coemansia javaensis]